MGKYEAAPKKKPAAKAADNKSKTPKKKGRIGLIIALTAVTLIAVAAIWLMQPPSVIDDPKGTGPSVTNTDPTQPTEPGMTAEPTEPARVRKKDFHTFLILGSNDNYNTDVIMLASLDLSNSKKPVMEVISIPRDSMVDYPSVIKRINGVYGYYGGKEKGATAVKEKVEEITGIYPDHYIYVDLKAFLKIVDVVGGVEFDVPYNMYHLDKDASQNINLRKGKQTLTANKALQLVRYRGTAGGDLDRMNVQKDFLLALFSTVKSNFTLSKIPDLVETVFGSIDTDIDTVRMIQFATNAYSIDIENDIHFDTLPISHMGKYASGNYGNQDYIYLDEEKIVEMINRTVNPFTTDITTDDITITILENK